MPSYEPALFLLLLTGLLLTILMPLLTWSITRHHQDQNDRIWFAGTLVHALWGLSFVWQGKTYALGACLSVLAALLMLESLLRGLQARRLPAWLQAAGLLCYGLTIHVLQQQQWFEASMKVMLTGYVLVELAVVVALVRLGRRHSSRGLLIVLIGFLSILTVNLMRLYQVLATGRFALWNDFTFITNINFLVFYLFVIFYSMGYWGFMVEKLHAVNRELIQAQTAAAARDEIARAQASLLRDSIRQRDEMLMLNSRFETVNSLSKLNSALLHELTQPLQSLQSILDLLTRAPDADTTRLRDGIAKAQAVSHRMGQIIGFLRTLIADQKTQREALDPRACLLDILPVLEAQAGRRGVQLVCHDTCGPDPLRVVAHPVMLQRTVFNAVANAMEAILGTRIHPAQPLAWEQHLPSLGQIRLDLFIAPLNGVPAFGIRITDSGPGFPASTLQAGPRAFETLKPDGMGLGLVLSLAIIESWDGRFTLANVTEAGETGAVVEMQIPLAPAPGEGSPTAPSSG